MSTDHHIYTVKWSAEDGEHVGLCKEFPSLSWLASSPEEALAGIRRIVAESVADMRGSIADEETAQFQADLFESVHSMKAGRAARVTHIESAPAMNLGSDSDDFLREEGIYGDVSETAMQRVREW